MRFKSLISAGIGFILAVSPLTAGSIQSSFSADTEGVVRIDLASLRGKSIIKDIESVYSAPREMGLAAFQAKSGIDIEKVNTIWMAGNSKHKGVVVMTGSFDQEAIKKATEENKRAKIVTRDDGRFATEFKHHRRTKTAVMIDGVGLVMGDQDHVDAFIKNIDGSGTSVSSDIQSKIDTIAQSSSVVTGEMFTFNNDKMKMMPFMKMITSGSFSLNIDTDINFKTEIKINDEKQADALIQMMEGWKMMAMSFKGGKRDFPIKKEVLESMVISKSTGGISITGAVKGDSIRDMIKIEI